MKTMEDIIVNALSALIVFIVLATLAVAAYHGIDKELTIREAHNHIHRHDLMQRVP